MFETEISTGESLISFGLQQVGIWIGFMVWGLVSSGVPDTFSHFGTTGRVLECITILVLGLGPGMLCGRLVRFLFPGAAAAGQWVWLLPVLFLSAALLGDVVHHGLSNALEELFFPLSAGEAWWAVVFLTCPVLGCIGYSVGVAGRFRFFSRRVRGLPGRSMIGLCQEAKRPPDALGRSA